MFVAIKCPSLDKDSAVVKFKATDTVLSLKQIIEATWAGAPRASGMRCIRSGRILSDTEVLGHLAEKPNLLPTQSTSSIPATDVDVLGSSSNEEMIDLSTAQVGADAYAVLEETLRVTAPENWPLLVEALSTACDEYVLLYERIYDESQVAQQATPTSTSAQPATQSDLLTSVETTLLGWDPVRVPSEDEAASAASASDAPETEYLYQQVSHRGLPYLLRVATTSLAAQRSEALHTLLHRITTLRAMTDKLDNIIMLGRLIQAQPSTAATASSGPTATAPGAAPAPALETTPLARLLRSTTAAIRAITWTDLTAIVIPLFFVGFKVGILLSMVLRGADTVKRYFVLGMATVYVVFESYRIVQRRMRIRQRLVRPVVPPAAPAAPMGANVPVAPAQEEVVERQTEENPFAPLPPPQAPVRQTARAWSTDWCLDQLAHLGLDGEDAELGLASSHRRRPTLAEKVLVSSWILPAVLFVVTMSPAVEQRRKRAIEERERVIRKWTRLEEERRQRMEEVLEEKRAKGEATDLTGMHSEGGVELQQKRVEYADRILRQRRTTEAVDVDEEDRLVVQQEDEEGLEDMNIF
uniref:Ubiquitin-like domain-containing protein n=1 Tax=Kalmanozyma brasiliensis (strain GHG001) TaxID=1365824 RepID=V5EDW0_KALBG